jgi:hypothetical protein
MGKPPDPPPIGTGPKAGYEHPRFPTVGPKDVSAPTGGYTSIINTSTPVDAGKFKQISSVKTPFKSYSGSSGNRSRSEFARALTDTSSQGMKRATDKFSTDYRKQAEKSRAEDLLGQRQNQLDRYRMDVFKDIFDTDTTTRYDEGTKDLNQYYETEKKNEQAKRTAMMLSFLGGLL